MLSVGFQSKSNVYFNNRNIVANNRNTLQSNVAADAFVLVREAAPVARSGEFQHIADVLKTLGVIELELGDNIVLARLLKSAMKRVKRLGYEVPTRIRCEAEFFEKYGRGKVQVKNGYSYIAPAATYWDNVNDPIIYFNPKFTWGRRENGGGSLSNDPMHIIWHETGHWLFAKQHSNDVEEYERLWSVRLNNYERNIVEKFIGKYAAMSPVEESIAEIFARLMSGEFYGELHPEIFNIYSKYRGPMPKFRPSNGG